MSYTPQKPSIGDSVHFFDREMGRMGKRVGPYAAIITYVYPDTVNGQYPVDIGRIYAPGDTRSDDEHCHAVMFGDETTARDCWWSWPERV